MVSKPDQRETVEDIRMANGGILQLQRFEGGRVRLVFAKGPAGEDCFPTREEARLLVVAMVREFEL